MRQERGPFLPEVESLPKSYRERRRWPAPAHTGLRNRATTRLSWSGACADGRSGTRSDRLHKPPLRAVGGPAAEPLQSPAHRRGARRWLPWTSPARPSIHRHRQDRRADARAQDTHHRVVSPTTCQQAAQGERLTGFMLLGEWWSWGARELFTNPRTRTRRGKTKSTAGSVDASPETASKAISTKTLEVSRRRCSGHGGLVEARSAA